MREVAAYNTMVQFLEARYDRLPSDALGTLLGELALQADGKPTDPAVDADWNRAVDRVSDSSETPREAIPMRRAG
jgi:hypothetical protein